MSKTQQISIRLLLAGGLGNQLFQYAFGRALAIRSGAQLVLDPSTLFRRDRRFQRSFKLLAFRLADGVRISSSRKLLWPLQRKVLSGWNQGRSANARSLILETRPFRYSREYDHLTISRTAIIEGYWQSPHYFSKIKDKIQCELEFRVDHSFAHGELLQEIQSVNSVGIHVRRVDYKTRLPKEYYRAALEEMGKKVEGARFYIFGDDLDWWTHHFGQMDNVVVFNGSNQTDLDDFRLLSHCRHFIIANSSFSWWAAWLGRFSGKRIIYPEKRYWDQPELYNSI